MGVYIRGMEMPKEFDPDVYIELACGIDGKRYARLYNFHQGGLTEWCEVVHVPPHGRLIDADKLKAKQQEDADLFINAVSLAEKSRRDEALNAVANIVNAPTIIPAEEGSNDS